MTGADDTSQSQTTSNAIIAWAQRLLHQLEQQEYDAAALMVLSPVNGQLVEKGGPLLFDITRQLVTRICNQYCQLATLTKSAESAKKALLILCKLSTHPHMPEYSFTLSDVLPCLGSMTSVKDLLYCHQHLHFRVAIESSCAQLEELWSAWQLCIDKKCMAILLRACDISSQAATNVAEAACSSTSALFPYGELLTVRHVRHLCSHWFHMQSLVTTAGGRGKEWHKVPSVDGEHLHAFLVMRVLCDSRINLAMPSCPSSEEDSWRERVDTERIIAQELYESAGITFTSATKFMAVKEERQPTSKGVEHVERLLKQMTDSLHEHHKVIERLIVTQDFCEDSSSCLTVCSDMKQLLKQLLHCFCMKTEPVCHFYIIMYQACESLKHLAAIWEDCWEYRRDQALLLSNKRKSGVKVDDQKEEDRLCKFCQVVMEKMQLVQLHIALLNQLYHHDRLVLANSDRILLYRNYEESVLASNGYADKIKVKADLHKNKARKMPWLSIDTVLKLNAIDLTQFDTLNTVLDIVKSPLEWEHISNKPIMYKRHIRLIEYGEHDSSVWVSAENFAYPSRSQEALDLAENNQGSQHQSKSPAYKQVSIPIKSQFRLAADANTNCVQLLVLLETNLSLNNRKTTDLDQSSFLHATATITLADCMSVMVPFSSSAAFLSAYQNGKNLASANRCKCAENSTVITKQPSAHASRRESDAAFVVETLEDLFVYFETHVHPLYIYRCISRLTDDKKDTGELHLDLGLRRTTAQFDSLLEIFSLQHIVQTMILPMLSAAREQQQSKGTRKQTKRHFHLSDAFLQESQTVYARHFLNGFNAHDLADEVRKRNYSNSLTRARVLHDVDADLFSMLRTFSSWLHSYTTHVFGQSQQSTEPSILETRSQKRLASREWLNGTFLHSIYPELVKEAESEVVNPLARDRVLKQAESQVLLATEALQRALTVTLQGSVGTEINKAPLQQLTNQQISSTHLNRAKRLEDTSKLPASKHLSNSPSPAFDADSWFDSLSPENWLTRIARISCHEGKDLARYLDSYQ